MHEIAQTALDLRTNTWWSADDLNTSIKSTAERSVHHCCLMTTLEDGENNTLHIHLQDHTDLITGSN